MDYTIRTLPFGTECLFWHTTEDGIDVNGNIPLADESEDPTEKIWAYIAAQLTPVQDVQSVQQEEKPSVLSFLEVDKERIKWETMRYMKLNPTSTLADFVEQLSVRDAALAQLLIIEYARIAYENGFVPMFVEDLNTCWAVLQGLTAVMTEEQIKEEL